MSKKLTILLCLFVIAARLNAQVTGTQPQQANRGTQGPTPGKRDYATFVDDFRKRYPDIPVQAKPQLQHGNSHTTTHNNTSYEAVRQQLIQRYPELKQQLTQKPVTTGAVNAEPRSYEWCIKNLLPRIQAMQKAAQQENSQQ
jgi:hypothetical protein